MQAIKDQAAADAVIEKIAAIGTVTLDSKDAIDAAQAAYDAAAAELAALQPAEEPDGNTEPAADSAEEPQSEPDSANGENAG